MANVNKYLEKCVAEYASTKNINNIRTAIIGIISADPTFSTGEFENAIKYVEKNNINLFETFDNKEFPPIQTVESKWDKSYFAKATIYCENNFCHERIKHLEAVGKQVFRRPITSISSGGYGENSKNLEGHQPEKGEDSQNKLPVWVIGMMAFIIIVIIIVIIIM